MLGSTTVSPTNWHLLSHRILVALLAMAMHAIPCASRAEFLRDSEGWTVLQPSPQSKVVYVSSSTGNDSNNGLSVNSPVKTVSKGKSLIRDNSNDFLLFKRGDTWHENFGDLFKGGLSAEAPLVISSYGTGARPLFNTGSSNGVTMWATSYANSHGGGYSNIVFNGLHFKADTYTGAQPGDNPTGIRIDRPGQNLLIEDVKVEGYSVNIVTQTYGSTIGQNIQIRRSVIVDAFAKRYDKGRPWDLPGSGTGTDSGYVDGGRSQGLYAAYIDGLLVEENVFDNNGWREGVPGAERTIYNHNLYFQSNNTPDITVRGNIIANGAAHAVQLRPGGVLEDNLFIGNGSGAFIEGAGGRAERNVFLNSSYDVQYALGDVNHGGTGPRDGGLSMGNVNGSLASGNLFLHTSNGSQGLRNTSGVNLHGNLVYKWGSTNLVYDNKVYDFPFPDPERMIATYDASIGGAGTTKSFLAGARSLSRDNWDSNYFAKNANSYFLAGFLETEKISGDYNGDGIVNAADYTVWLQSYGQTGTDLAADGSGPSGSPDNVVDEFDYLLWKTQFGVSSSAVAVSIPEPSSLKLLLGVFPLFQQVRTFRSRAGMTKVNIGLAVDSLSNHVE